MTALPAKCTRHATMADAPTRHSRLLAWVREVAELTTPDRIVWCDGSDAEWQRLTDELVDGRHAGAARPGEASPTRSGPAPTRRDVARVEERTFICSVDPADAGPTNNWMAPAEMKATMTELYRGCMRGRTMYVDPVLHGPARRPTNPMFGVEITDSAVRRGLHADHDPDGRRRCWRRWATDADFVPALHSVGAPLEPGQADVAVAVQRDQVHLALPGDPGDLVVRLRVRRQLAARQEVLLAAHRQRDGPRRGLAGRAHADPQAHLARAAGALHRRRVPVGVRQDQPGHAGADHPRLEGRDARRRHRLDAVRRGRPALRGQPRVRPVRRRARAPTGRPTPTPCAPWPGATRSSPTWPAPTTATSGGRAWASRRRTSPTGRATTGRPDSGELSSHPNSRFCTPITQCPILAAGVRRPERRADLGDPLRRPAQDHRSRW